MGELIDLDSLKINFGSSINELNEHLALATLINVKINDSLELLAKGGEVNLTIHDSENKFNSLDKLIPILNKTGFDTKKSKSSGALFTNFYIKVNDSKRVWIR